MSIEAFLWNYRGGKPIGFDFDSVREILSTDESEWIDRYGLLRVHYGGVDNTAGPHDFVDIYLGKGALITGQVDGIMISRPLQRQDFLRRVFCVMQLGDVMLFYSDETTPVFICGADPGQYPSELLQELGVPRFVDSPVGLLHQT